MWGQAADIGERVDLHPQQFQAGIADGELEGDARQTQEAGGIGRTDEPVDEGRLDLVEIGFRRSRARGTFRLVRRLPLHGRALGRGVIVSGSVRRMDMVVMMIVRVVMIVSMSVIVVMMTVMMMAHGGPQ
jgi:hypothetical protein